MTRSRRGRLTASTPARRPRLRRLAALPLLAALAAGCGIRATEVPTDFGPAPSRVHCSASEPDVSPSASPRVRVKVFLLCGTSLVAVTRSVDAADDGSADRVRTAQQLLDQLAAAPSAAEREAGYTTSVRDGVKVTGPRGKDPEDTLRLSYPPDALTRTSLGQIVCTLSDSAAVDGEGSVILAGPDADSPPRRYTCTDQVRAEPQKVSPPTSRAHR